MLLIADQAFAIQEALFDQVSIDRAVHIKNGLPGC